MSNNGIFKLLTELSEFINSDNDVQTLDFTKKEDVEKLEKAVETLKDNEFFSALFDDSLFDVLLDKAHKIYEEAHKDDDKGPKRPSSNVSKDVKKIVKGLATQYVAENVEPYVKSLTEEQKNEIIDSLFEFGCWIYNK